MSLLAASFQADPADCLPPVSYTLYTISLKSSMVYIYQIPILVQAQICTWLIVYTKKDLCTVHYAAILSYFISYILMPCVLTAYCCATSFMEKLILPILSLPRHTTVTTSPRVRTSSTRLILSLAILPCRVRTR